MQNAWQPQREREMHSLEWRGMTSRMNEKSLLKQQSLITTTCCFQEDTVEPGTEKDAEKYSVYFNNILRAKVERCTVLAVLFPISLSLNTKQMECKIFQLVAATIKSD